MIGIIDYGSGNLGAIANIYKQLKIEHVISGNLSELERADRYILPGVGHFDTTMSYVRSSGLLEVLTEQVLGNLKKIMGICVGMQLLADSSEEGQTPGLGWIPGRVRKIDTTALNAKPGLPHMGWNSIKKIKTSPLLDNIDLERGFYFLHSYYFDAKSNTDVISTVTYGKEMPCGVAHKNIFGFQFHPEKGHNNGINVFRNFAAI